MRTHGGQNASHLAAHVAVPAHAHGGPSDLRSHRIVVVVIGAPIARFDLAIALGDLPGCRHDHGNRVLRRGNGVAPRGIGHHHAVAGGGLNIHVHGPATSDRDELEIGTRGNHALGEWVGV